MKKALRASMVALVCLGLFLTGVGNAFAAKPVELSFVSDYVNRHPVTQKGFMPWMASVNKMTNGRVKIHYYMPNTLAPAKEGYDATINGMIDILGEPAFYSADRFPEMLILGFPFISPGSEAGGLVAMDILDKFPKVKAKFGETKLLYTWAAASMQLNTTKKLVKTLEDLKGLRIIVFNAQLASQIKALGANPILMIPPDIYMALQRGTADGVLFPFAPLKAMKITDVTKFHTIIDYGTGPFHAVMNKERFESLPADVQKVLEETTGRKMTRKVGRILDMGSKMTSKWMKANGHTFYKLPDAERERWKVAVHPAVEKSLSKYQRRIPYARALYQEAVKLGKKYKKMTGSGFAE